MARLDRHNSNNLTLVKSGHKTSRSRVEKLMLVNIVLTIGLMLLVLLGR